MCLIAWNWKPGAPTPLLLIANRDEFYTRPTKALSQWADGRIVAGKDLDAGGTWLGITRTGRLAALTNYRAPALMRTGTPSRGELVTAFLNSELAAPLFLEALAGRAERYNPFNLLVYDGVQLMGLQSRGAQVVSFAPGIGAVSNADFQLPWPKLTALSQGLSANIESGETSNQALLALLQNSATAPDEALPQTGLSLERERALSAAFIATPDYGTRACSIVRMGQTHAEFTEHGFDANGFIAATSQVVALVV